MRTRGAGIPRLLACFVVTPRRESDQERIRECCRSEEPLVQLLQRVFAILRPTMHHGAPTRIKGALTADVHESRGSNIPSSSGHCGLDLQSCTVDGMAGPDRPHPQDRPVSTSKSACRCTSPVDKRTTAPHRQVRSTPINLRERCSFKSPQRWCAARTVASSGRRMEGRPVGGARRIRWRWHSMLSRDDEARCRYDMIARPARPIAPSIHAGGGCRSWSPTLARPSPQSSSDGPPTPSPVAIPLDGPGAWLDHEPTAAR